MSVPAPRVAMPGRFKGAMVIMVVQIVVNAFGGLMLISDINDRNQYGQQIPGVAYVATAVDLFFAVALLTCVLRLRSGGSWVRPLAKVLESAVMLSAIINLAAGQYLSIGGLALAIVVVVLLSGPENRYRG
ncbi:MAG: hypothetical protein JWQ81_7603 [Amycolatopsis sp.]|jgi:hypothetical protein|uniref:hypothetical protein n=1 Tax=Amycolatopsis sp. TaxID=37632 RepID=UPI00263A1072|nr:hypothetical protein [Amycolatopsis sp.]MCU1686864.1 hypothetical protein [Amycolatopsis sp.]